MREEKHQHQTFEFDLDVVLPHLKQDTCIVLTETQLPYMYVHASLLHSVLV